MRLFCFPYAGGGASAYRSWIGSLGPTIDVYPVQLPGRETRQDEAPFKRMDALVAAVLEGLRSSMDVPFAFFGHSMGALVAFELARRLRDHPKLRWLFVSARRAPHLPEPLSAIAGLPSRDFVATVQQRYGGVPEAVLACTDLVEFLLPRLRADFEVLETYVCRPAEPLPCGISVFGGSADRLSLADLRAWQEHTRRGLRLRMISGSHLYLDSGRHTLLTAISEDLALDRPADEVRW